MSNKPLILVSNDDSVYAKGIKVLAEIASEFGEVVVVAPDSVQSAKSHAVTLDKPLIYSETAQFNGHAHLAYKCNGTPADCVKIGIHEILNRRPDLVLSGVNHGSNSSVNIFYSGTVAAAIEGAFHNIPSAAFSLTTYDTDPDFTLTRLHVRKIIAYMLENPLPNGTCLNVNIPFIPAQESNGIKVCRQNIGVWAEKFEKRKHPRGYDYHWLTAEFINLRPDAEDDDLWALNNNYTTVVPIKIDITDYELLDKMDGKLVD